MRRTVRTSLGGELCCEMLEAIVDDPYPIGHQLLGRLSDRSGRRIVEGAAEGNLPGGHVAGQAVDELAFDAAEALAFLAEQLDFRRCLRRRLLGFDHLVAAVPLLDGPVRLVAEAVQPGDPVRGCFLAGGAAELIPAGSVRLFHMEGDVAVGEFFAFDPQFHFE